MKAQDLKKSFHKRSPKFLPESFLIDKNKVRKILDSVRSEVSGKQKGERTKEKESSEDFIKTQREIFAGVLFSQNKDTVTGKKAMEKMVKTIKEWNTAYEPEERDYKKLSEELLNFLKRENIIMLPEKGQ